MMIWLLWNLIKTCLDAAAEREAEVGIGSPSSLGISHIALLCMFMNKVYWWFTTDTDEITHPEK